MTTCPVYAIPLDHLHGVTLVATLRGGPRFEAPDEGGLTHFLEHMLFRGAGLYPNSRELFAAFEQIGGEPEAYTTDDALVISLEADPTRLELAVDLLAQVLLEPRYEDLELEREVILSERLEKLDDAGRNVDLDDLARSLAFQGHPLARSIVGEDRALRRYGASDLERMRSRMVRRHNLVIVAAGQVDPERLRRATTPLEGVPAGGALADQAPLQCLPGPRSAFLEVEGSQQVDMRFTFTGPGISDPDHHALGVVVDVLDGGPTSRLPERLVDSGLAYHAQAELITFPDLSLIEVDVSVSRRRSAEAVERVLQLLSGLGEGIEPQELERAATRRGHRARRLSDDAREQAEWHARRLLHGLPCDRAAEEAAAASIDQRGAEALARSVFRPEGLTAVMVGAPTGKQRGDARRALRSWAGR